MRAFLAILLATCALAMGVARAQSADSTIRTVFGCVDTRTGARVMCAAQSATDSVLGDLSAMVLAGAGVDAIKATISQQGGQISTNADNILAETNRAKAREAQLAPLGGTVSFAQVNDADLSGSTVHVNGALGQLEGMLEAMTAKTAQAQTSANSAVAVLNAPLTVGALPATPAGQSHIGSVGVDALPALPAGSNMIGSTTSPTLDPAASATVQVTSAVAVLPALATRHGWVLSNSSTSGASGYAYCTDDGSAPTPTHWTIIVYGQGSTPNPPGVPVSSKQIQCAPPSGGASDISVTGEQW